MAAKNSNPRNGRKHKWHDDRPHLGTDPLPVEQYLPQEQFDLECTHTGDEPPSNQARLIRNQNIGSNETEQKIRGLGHMARQRQFRDCPAVICAA